MKPRFTRVGVIASSWLALLSGFVAAQETAPDAPERSLVGRLDQQRIVTPVNQELTPWGRLLELPGLRPQTLALAPDGSILVTSGKTSELIVLDPESGDIRQRVDLPSDEQGPSLDSASDGDVVNSTEPDRSGQASYTGLVFSPDGSWIFLSNVNGSIKVFRVLPKGDVRPSHTIPLPPADAPRRREEIPSGLAISADGRVLYVCGNLSNRLLEVDIRSGKLLRTIDVGALPYDIRIVGKKAIVSNWGGRRPTEDVPRGPAGKGTEVRIDPLRHIASEGSVSIIDLPSGTVTRELVCGRHASGLAISPDRRYVLCANAASDTISVIDLEQELLVATLWAKPKPSDLFGASPNALAFSEDGSRVYVANGTQNAVAVMDFDPQKPRRSKLRGLIPVGWFPGAIVVDPRRDRLYVANIKGLADQPLVQDDGSRGFNAHQYQGSISLVRLPTDDQLAELSEQVARNMRRGVIEQAQLPPRSNQPPRAIPERIGEPSRIRHVVYIIKENRTYDQVFGDLPQGRGQAELCTFGEAITPNQHKLAREFVLLDNTYCAGILSADGHQWSTTAFSTDYMEKSFAGFPRSYPDGMDDEDVDAMAYAPSGFIWDNALRCKRSIRNYGEFMIPRVRWSDPKKPGRPGFLDCYQAWKTNSGEVRFASEPGIETIRPFSPTAYVGWEMAVPDQYRADFIIRELKRYESQGTFPDLVIVCLPNDHTSGTSPGCPTPAACVADNDLAFGRIVEALSHSKFWNEMAIFAIEDDPQSGWDHVSGYRTIAFCISPFTKRGAVVSTQYNTTSILRTIEQILGMPPMNQFDASATPMFDCFTETPDFTPYQAVPSAIPLDQMNPDPSAIGDAILRRDAEVSATLNFQEVDKAPEGLLNRILWRAMKGSHVPYPGDAQLPGLSRHP